MTALHAHDLGKRYGRKWALRDCAFEVPKGSVTALIGANGAGKSTLLGIGAGLVKPTGGALTVEGTIGFLAQHKPLYPRFTVADTLRFGREMNPNWDAHYASTLLEEAGLDEKAVVRTLSGGQRARLALIIVLGRRPDVLLLDEPLADLDPLAREDVMRALMGEVAETGLTVVLSSHVLPDVANVCDRIILLQEGKVRLTGEIDELIATHRLEGGGRVVPGTNGERPNLEELVLSYLRTGVVA